MCVGWKTSIAVSLSAPGERRLHGGVTVAGAQVLLRLAERLVPERGRAAIHEADIVEAVNSNGAEAVSPAVPTGVGAWGAPGD